MKSPIPKIVTLGDKILVILIFALGIVSLVALKHLRLPGDAVIIEVKGLVVQRLDLNTSQEITIIGAIGKTTVKIESGAAQVVHSDCPEKICVKTGKITHAGEIIVCVPNKVVVKIIGKQKNSYDVITH
jgi:hypothetical protein